MRSHRRPRLLLEAESMILHEVGRCETVDSARHGHGAHGRMHVGPVGRRRRWAAYQIILYGTESYGWLLGGAVPRL